ncbi:MAG: TRM11 family methyltransferase [Candidatus Aenigmatarchaeota archaeon]
MKKYIFDFGRNYNLSLTELISYLKMRERKFKILEYSEDGVLLSISNFDPLKASRRLGGIKRIGKIICTDYRKLEELDLYRRIEEKLFYGIKEIPNSGRKEAIRKILKNKFKEENLKAMYKEMNLGELVKKNSLEILTFSDRYVGRTVSISNPLDFQSRDNRRPNKNREITTSIRISDILLNLAQVKKDEIVLDPFCGNGTILQEALLFGSEVRGLDIKEGRVKETVENLKWFKKEYSINKKFEIRCGDSRKVSKYFPENSIDKIVSEPELGPMLKKLPKRNKAKNIMNNLEDLYSDFFREVSKILKKNGIMVIVLPQLKTKDDEKYKMDVEKITHDNFKISKSFQDFGISIPLEYSERWHKLERLIYVFKRN